MASRSAAPARPAAKRAALVGAALFLLTDGPLFFAAHEVLGRPGPHWGDPVVLAGLFGTIATAAAVAIRDLRHSGGDRPRRPTVPAAAAVAVFALLTVASTAWSVSPLRSGWRSPVYVGLAVLAWLAADLDEHLRTALAVMAGAAVASSLAVVALIPGVGLDAHDDWQGIYLSRNLLAPVAAVGVIVAVRMLCDSAHRQRLGGALLGAGSLAAMAGAGSRTAWLALVCGAGLATVPLLRHRIAARRGARAAVRASWACLAAGLAVLAAVLATLWDTPTLAQRRTIWSVCWEQFLERPLHGHALTAVWSYPDFLDNHELLSRGSAHNGPLEVALGLGLLGLAPFGVIVFLAVRNAGRDLVRSPGADTWMWAAVVAVMLIENLTESFILRLSYNWVIVMAAALRVPGRMRLRAEPAGTAAPDAPRHN